MAGGHGHRPVGVSAAHRHGCQQQAQGHGGAGTVESQVGDARIAQGKGGADALIQQVPGAHQIDVPGLQPGLLQQLVQGKLLHFLFRLLPGFFTEFRIHAFDIEAVAQGPLGLFFACHTGPLGDIHRLARPEGVTAKLVLCHVHPSFPG